MATIYRRSDRIPVKMEDLTVYIRPLTVFEKSKIQEYILNGETIKGAYEAVKCAVVDIKGINNADGSAYELEKKDGYLTEECLDDLMNLSQSTMLNLVCLNLLQNIPDELIDPNTGEKLEGVEFIKGDSSEKK